MKRKNKTNFNKHFTRIRNKVCFEIVKKNNKPEIIVSELYADVFVLDGLWELRIYRDCLLRKKVESVEDDLRRYKYRLLSARCCRLSTVEGKRIMELLRCRVADSKRNIGWPMTMGRCNITPLWQPRILVRWRGVALAGSEAKPCTVHASITAILISGSIQYRWRISPPLVSSAPAFSPRKLFLWQILLIHSCSLGRSFTLVKRLCSPHIESVTSFKNSPNTENP